MIAIRLVDSPVAKADTSSILTVLNRAFSAGIERNVDEAERLADVVVKVPVDKWSASDYGKGAELIDAGYQAAAKYAVVLLPYALSTEDWGLYLAARSGRRAARPGTLRQVRVEGGPPAAVREVLADLRPIQGQPISPAATLSAISPIQSNGGYGATWETFNPSGPPTNLEFWCV